VNKPIKSVIVVGFHEIEGKKKLKFQVWFRLKINALKAVYQTKELVCSERSRPGNPGWTLHNALTLTSSVWVNVRKW